MILSLFATLMIASVGAEDKLVCPVMGGAANLKLPSVEFAGAKYWFCCGGCDADFKKEPAKFLKAILAEKSTAGLFLFDPVSHDRLDLEKAKGGTVDYKGVRYPFATPEDKDAFLKSPETYSAVPKQGALYCAVGKEAVAAPSKASAYYDYKGVRHYMCCAGCERTFDKTPDLFAEQSKPYVKDLQVVATPIEAKTVAPKAEESKTFACTHCGKKMTVKGEIELKTRCKACGCGVNAEFCQPPKG